MSHELPFPPVIDSSMRSAFVACPEQWRRRYLEGWAKPGVNMHLHFGGAFAKAMDTFRQTYYNLEVPNHDEALQAAMAAGIKFWGDVDPSGNGTNKSLERLLGGLESFTNHYNPLTDWAQPHRAADGKLCTEFSFAIPLLIKNPSTGEPILYSGRFDQIVEDARGGKILMGEDDKTTTQLGEQWTRQWRLRGQFTGYTWGAREWGYNLQGFLVRGISILKRDYGHAEIIEQRPDHMIDDWYENLNYDIDRMITYWHLNRWPKALDSACSSYGGCQFIDLCASREPEKWLSQFEHKPFDPLRVGEEA